MRLSVTGEKRRASGGDINARYGVDPGFSFYTHVSDQHGPYHVKVISAATHEAPYVLDGLLHHGSNLAIAEHLPTPAARPTMYSRSVPCSASAFAPDCATFPIVG